MDEGPDTRAQELAAIYDAIYAGRDDTAFWRAVAGAADGPVLELGCGTGRILIPLVRAGFEVTGLDLSPAMLALCREKLALEVPEVRARAHLVHADMTSFDLGRRFSAILCPFAGFQQLTTVEQQLACLERCRAHLPPKGRLVLDLPNPDPAPPSHTRETPGSEQEPMSAEWTEGRTVRWRMTEADYDRLQQCVECSVLYEISEPDGAMRALRETLVLRYVFRFELEHLLVRSGFRLLAWHGGYDGGEFAADSPAMIAVAEPTDA